MKRLTIQDPLDGSRKVSIKNAGNHTLTGLQTLRKDRNLCDVILQVEGVEIWAHRNILMVNSNYFRSMFADGFHETLTREITLAPGTVDRESVEDLVDFMYTGSLSLTSQSVQGLIQASDLWQMAAVKQTCVDYMERLIDAQNCLGILSFAETYQCDKLASKSEQLIKQRFPAVVLTYEFQHLSADRLLQILDFTDLTLGHEGEDVVLEAVFRWLDFNETSRAPDLPALLRKVRLTATSRQCRKRFIDENPTVQNSKELTDLTQELMEEEHIYRKAQTTLYVIGGFLQSRTGPRCPRLRGVESLDSTTNVWTPCADFPMLTSASVAFSLHSHLFCAAQQAVDASHANVAMETRMWHYSLVRDEWAPAQDRFSPESLETVATCLSQEGALAVCEKTNTIYTMSNNEVSCITVNLIDGDVYCRDTRLLPRPRPEQLFSVQHRLHSAIVCDQRLYVMGGDRHDHGSDVVATATVIMLDPQTNQWVTRCSMLEPRAKMAVAQIDGQIYACGGFNIRRLATMERYDPARDVWTAMAPMNKYRSHHQLLALHGKLYAMGGKSYAYNNGGARKVLNMCEIYDPQTDTWTEGPPMKSARCGFAAVAI